MTPFSHQLTGGRLARGKWRIVIRDRRRCVKVACPSCGIEADLDGHAIDQHGNVLPSAACPGPGCHFHDHIRLIGWEPQQAVEQRP